MRLALFYLTLAAIVFAVLMVLPASAEIPKLVNWRLLSAGVITGLLIAAAASFVTTRFGVSFQEEEPVVKKEDDRQG